MTILNTSTVTELVSWYGKGLIICGIIAIIGYFIFGIYDNRKSDILFIIGLLMTLGGIIGIFTIGIAAPQVETDRKQYEVIIDDSVTFHEIYEKYKVIDQRGDIWILEDKE